MPRHDLAYFLLSVRESIKGFHYLFRSFDNWHDFVLLWFGARSSAMLSCRSKKGNLRTVHIDMKKERIKILYKGKQLLFWFGSRRQLANAMRNIYQNFIEEQYASMDVRGRGVVDIGANNGDSAMYFVANGASKVYAYEPYPFMFDQARKNVRLNRMERKIVLLNEAVDKRSGKITLDDGYQSVSNSMLERSKHGKRIRVTTLNSIVKDYKIRNAVLKMDCEGSEYGILSSASASSMLRFDQVAIEYHFGHEGLVKRLEAEGFKVTRTPSKVARNAETNGLKMVYGVIYAKR